jgi:hypothetical protein
VTGIMPSVVVLNVAAPLKVFSIFTGFNKNFDLKLSDKIEETKLTDASVAEERLINTSIMKQVNEGRSNLVEKKWSKKFCPTIFCDFRVDMKIMKIF